MSSKVFSSVQMDQGCRGFGIIGLVMLTLVAINCHIPFIFVETRMCSSKIVISTVYITIARSGLIGTLYCIYPIELYLI